MSVFTDLNKVPINLIGKTIPLYFEYAKALIVILTAFLILHGYS